MAPSKQKQNAKKQTSGPLSESKNWYEDRYQYVKVQRNILALVTVACLLIALVANLNTYQLAPLKSVQPFVVQTDSVTGLTKVVKPLERHELTALEALSESFLVQYVQARESYDYYLYPPSFSLVRLMSHNQVFEDYYNYIEPSLNKASPLNLFGRETRKAVSIKSVSVFLNKDPKSIDPHQAQVRIRVRHEGKEARHFPDQHLAVWIAFQYVPAPSNDEDRFKNPLGFQVVSYRVDKEVAQ